MPASQYRNEPQKLQQKPQPPRVPQQTQPQGATPSLTAQKRGLSVSAPGDQRVFAKPQEEPDVLSGFRKKQQQQQKPMPAASEQSITQTPSQTETPAVKVTDTPTARPLRLIGEAFKTYILCEYDGKLYIIDKHAAHERILFNKLRETKKEDARQVLLAPVQIPLSREEYHGILSNLDVFQTCGFLIEDFGSNCVVVRECPMLLETDDVQDVVLEIAENLLRQKTDVQAEKINRIYETAACKAAIKAGNKNSTAELKALAERVLYHDDVRYCPHGRPVLIEMSRYDLEKQFGRIQ